MYNARAKGRRKEQTAGVKVEVDKGMENGKKGRRQRTGKIVFNCAEYCILAPIVKSLAEF